MKYLITAFTFLLLTAMSCKKNRDQNDKLPPETQSGANTFGCLVNGKVYIPVGSSGTTKPNLRTIYEYFNGRTYLFVDTYRYVNNQYDGGIYFTIDSLEKTGIYPIRTDKNKLFYGGKFFNNCGISGYDSTTFQNGNFVITKIDLAKGIISGTFNCKIKPIDCDTITISDGRFDFKL